MSDFFDLPAGKRTDRNRLWTAYSTGYRSFKTQLQHEPVNPFDLQALAAAVRSGASEDASPSLSR